MFPKIGERKKKKEFSVTQDETYYGVAVKREPTFGPVGPSFPGSPSSPFSPWNQNEYTLTFSNEKQLCLRYLVISFVIIIGVSFCHMY